MFACFLGFTGLRSPGENPVLGILKRVCGKE
jgi:hypothetical protein